MHGHGHGHGRINKVQEAIIIYQKYTMPPEQKPEKWPVWKQVLVLLGGLTLLGLFVILRLMGHMHADIPYVKGY